VIHGREEMTLFHSSVVNSRHNPFPYPEWQPVQPEASSRVAGG
jgi:hypothetical protein